MSGHRTQIRVLCALLAAAGLAALRSRARSRSSRWRRPAARHARPQVSSHPRPYIPGIGHLDVPLDVKPVPFPPSMPARAEMTVMDFPPAMARPYLTYARPGRPAAGMHQGAA